jgi:predicted CopG family antitoxin
MATKSITITTDAYDLLARHKGAHESFSDVITRIAKKNNFLELKGVLSKEHAEELSRHVKELRKAADREMDERLKKFKW